MSTAEPPGAGSPFAPMPPAGDAPPPPMLERLGTGPLPAPAPLGEIAAEEPAWMQLLRNRLILGGLGIVALLTVTAIVLVAIGSGDGGSNRAVVGDRTPDPNETFVVRGGLPGRMTRTVSMRAGPGPSYQIVGTVPRQARVAVIGRSDDSEWLQLNYPPGSTIKGWVLTEFVQVTGDISSLPIGAASEGPDIVVPTFIPVETPIVVLPTEPFETLVPTEPLETPTDVPTATEPPLEPTATPEATTPFGGAGRERPRSGNGPR